MTAPLPPPGSPPPSGPGGPAPAVATAGRRAALVPAIVAVVALLVGIGLGALLFGGDDEAAPEGAAADVAAGCALIAGLPADVDIDDLRDDDDWSIDGPYTYRVEGASGAFHAAANADREYREFGELGEALRDTFRMMQVDELPGLIDDARERCDELD